MKILNPFIWRVKKQIKALSKFSIWHGKVRRPKVSGGVKAFNASRPAATKGFQT